MSPENKEFQPSDKIYVREPEEVEVGSPLGRFEKVLTLHNAGSNPSLFVFDLPDGRTIEGSVDKYGNAGAFVEALTKYLTTTAEMSVHQANSLFVQKDRELATELGLDLSKIDTFYAEAQDKLKSATFEKSI